MGKNGVATFSQLFMIGSISYLQVTMTYMRAWMSLKFGQIRLLVPMANDRVIMDKNGVVTFSRLIFIRSFLYLQVIMTCMGARTSSNFGKIRPRASELRPLKDVRNWFLLIILRMDGQNLTKFCIHIIIDKIYIAIVKRHFSQICNRVTALDRCQKLVFAQYLENG